MIYFKNETLKFPKHSGENVTKIKLINELTNEVTEYNVTDLSTEVNKYEFDLSNLDLKNGTYKYLFGKEVGLMQVGDYTATATTYNERKTNVVYERN